MTVLACAVWAVMAGDLKGVERVDENSRQAHQDLLLKANTGTTDLYFIGDSITRRWGCTDPAWSHLRVNWTKHFYGWNASNFAWGGDGTLNMLWRLQNGELDGVNPKVIVFMGGTNDIGGDPKAPGLAETVMTRVRAIVATCRQKAPHAKIVLTATFPRFDGKTANTVIHDLNGKIKAFAEGQGFDFVDITDKIQSRDGREIPGMLQPDHLHADAPTYDAWAQALEPILTRYLGPKKAIDQAPAMTGDPSIKKKKG